MLKHRCPWCGEKIPFRLPFVPSVWELRLPNICSTCKKPYASYHSWLSFIVLASGLVWIYFLVVIIKSNIVLNWFLEIAGLLALTILFIELCRIPYARDVKKNGVVITKQQTAVTITWESHKKDGLLLPRFQMQNGEIFPACFLDAQGNSISTAFCVTLENLKWQNAHHCTCNISLVLDDAPIETLFLPGNQLFLYHNYRKIAKGIIVAF